MAKAKRERQERRFYPKSTANPKLVAVAGGLGAALAGAGAYGQFGPMKGYELTSVVPWLLAGGAALIGAAFWFGTSGEPALRVGDAGVAGERGGTVRRIAWHAIESVTMTGEAVVVTGADEAGATFAVMAKLASHPLAAAWIVKEARARVPKVVDVSDEAAERLTATGSGDGVLVKLEPVQVVGKRCAATDKVISFEPDARVCARCERVYHKNHVPKKCACGASLGGSKGKGDEDAA